MGPARGLAEMQRLALQQREDSSTGLDLVLMDIQVGLIAFFRWGCGNVCIILIVSIYECKKAAFYL